MEFFAEKTLRFYRLLDTLSYTNDTVRLGDSFCELYWMDITDYLNEVYLQTSEEEEQEWKDAGVDLPVLLQGMWDMQPSYDHLLKFGDELIEDLCDHIEGLRGMTYTIKCVLEKMYVGRVVFIHETQEEYEYDFEVCRMEATTKEEVLDLLVESYDKFGLSMEEIQDYLIQQRV